MLAAGGTQLNDVLADRHFRVAVPCGLARSVEERVDGAENIAVAPYHYLCGGQLTNCVPQPGSERRLDAQGDKIMPRLVYRESTATNRSSPCTP